MIVQNSFLLLNSACAVYSGVFREPLGHAPWQKKISFVIGKITVASPAQKSEGPKYFSLLVSSKKLQYT